jgi:hypothetical protein
LAAGAVLKRGRWEGMGYDFLFKFIVVGDQGEKEADLQKCASISFDRTSSQAKIADRSGVLVTAIGLQNVTPSTLPQGVVGKLIIGGDPPPDVGRLTRFHWCLSGGQVTPAAAVH